MLPEPKTNDEGQPISPAALPTGGSQVRQAPLCFSVEDEDEAVTPTEEPSTITTDFASEAASSTPAASQSAATPNRDDQNQESLRCDRAFSFLALYFRGERSTYTALCHTI